MQMKTLCNQIQKDKIKFKITISFLLEFKLMLLEKISNI